MVRTYFESKALAMPLLCFFLFSPFLHAKIVPGCSLDYPDTDLRRMYPGHTNYKVRDLIPKHLGRGDLFSVVEKELGEKLDSEFEQPEGPHTFYQVFKNEQELGRVHCVNAKVHRGRAQVFVIFDAKGQVLDIYLQKLDSPDAHAFRSKYYRKQFKRFSIHNPPDAGYVHPPIRAPSAEAIKDHHLILRAVKINVLFAKQLWNFIS